MDLRQATWSYSIDAPVVTLEFVLDFVPSDIPVGRSLGTARNSALFEEPQPSKPKPTKAKRQQSFNIFVKLTEIPFL